MSVTVTGTAELKAKMLKLGDQMEIAAEDGVFITAQDVRTAAIKSIQDLSPGAPVKRSRQGGGTYDHIAAAEGQAPNTDTGALVSSISAEKIGDASYEIGTNLERGQYLEMGTAKMRPRPWLVPALDVNRNNLLKNIEKAVDLHIRKLTK
jgi:HK97 gp10 family phage protein